MLSSLLTDMCLDTINSTTKFSPVISRCNFAGVNGMSLHLQTEKLEISPFPGNSAQPGSSAAPARASPDFARRFYPATAAPLPSPLPVRRPGPPSSLPRPSRRGQGATGQRRRHTNHRPREAPDPDAGQGRRPRRRRPPLAHSAPVPASAGRRGRPAAPSRPSPAHGGQRRSPGRRRAGAGWKLTWG